MSASSLADLRSHMFVSLRRIGRKFTEPDDDWVQVMAVQSPKGIEIAEVEVPWSGQDKEILGEVLRRAVAEYGAYRYALVLNTHMLKNADPETMARVRREEVRISELPGAREMLTLVLGDAETEETWTALIERDGVEPPKLGAWEKADRFEGRFAGLNAYMRQPRT